jgi:hypothetical protein
MTTATIDRSPANDRTSRSISRQVPTVARVLMGLVFFVFGLNGFLHFIPQPPPPQPATLALALIAPIIVNIVAFHVALAPSGLPLALVVLVLELLLAWSYRGSFRPMLVQRVAPRGVSNAGS